MIYIDKNSTNLVALTLRETADILSNTYLFEFINDSTQESTFLNKTAIVNNIRYTGFQFIDGDSQELDLRPGQYTYNVYLLPINSISTDPVDAIQMLETGRMYAIGEWSSVDTVYQ